jgi:hypothetical protein
LWLNGLSACLSPRRQGFNTRFGHNFFSYMLFAVPEKTEAKFEERETENRK